MRRNSSSATCAGMKILKRDLRSCEKNSAFAFVLRSWPSCADVQQAKFDSHNHAQPNMNQAIIANQTCQVMKDASTAILECKSWKSKLTRRGPNNYGSCFFFSCWLLLAVVFPIFYESTFILRPTVESLGGWLRCLLKLGWPGKEPREPGSWCCIGEIWWCNSCRIGVIK